MRIKFQPMFHVKHHPVWFRGHEESDCAPETRHGGFRQTLQGLLWICVVVNTVARERNEKNAGRGMRLGENVQYRANQGGGVAEPRMARVCRGYRKHVLSRFLWWVEKDLHQFWGFRFLVPESLHLAVIHSKAAAVSRWDGSFPFDRNQRTAEFRCACQERGVYVIKWCLILRQKWTTKWKKKRQENFAP